MKRGLILVISALIVGSTAVVASAQEAPAGTIAYATNKAVFTISSDGTNKTKLFQMTGRRTCCPKVSPDGTRVLFQDYGKNGMSSLKVAHLQSGEVTQVAGSKFSVGSTAWSPDGKMIAFTAYGDGREGVYTAKANGNGRTRQWDRVSDTIDWNRDGTKLAFNDYRKTKSRIFYVDFNTHEVYRLPADFSIDAYTPMWSPTEDVLAFLSFVPMGESASIDLYTVNFDGTNLVKLNDEGESVSRAEWAPDGSVVAFSSDMNQSSSLSSIQPDGSGRQVLATDHDDASTESYLTLLGYSPDGSQIAFDMTDLDASTFDFIGYGIHTMNSDGTSQSPRTNDQDVFFIQWAPDSESLLLCSYNTDNLNGLLQYLQGEAYHDIANSCDANWGP